MTPSDGVRMPQHLGVIMPAGAPGPIVYTLAEPAGGAAIRDWTVMKAQQLGSEEPLELTAELLDAIAVDRGSR